MNHPPSKDIQFSDLDFKEVAKIALSDFGLSLEISKKQLVYSRISKRLRALGIESFKKYCTHISSAAGADEKSNFLSALTTNVTQFFREDHHFEYMKSHLFPVLREKALKGKRVRIWSAGCSAGQEAYSIALTLINVFPEASRYDVKILATDIDEYILEQAILGRYPNEQLQQIPNEYHRSTLRSKIDGKCFEISQTVRDLVSFGRLNLISSWPISRPFDLILCRNVAIYFNNETQATLWNRFACQLETNGVLMIGHSERINGPASKLLSADGITTYRRR